MKVKIIYGTEMGTTHQVAKIMAAELEKLGHDYELHQVGIDGLEPEISGWQVLLIGSPTYSEGDLETSMREFINTFQPSLESYHIGVFSLGSKGFTHFCRSAELLEEWVKKKEGHLLGPALKIDGYPAHEEPIRTWVRTVLQQVAP